MDVSALRTPTYRAHASDDKFVQVYSKPASGVVYKDKAKVIRIKKKFRYLHSPYVDYCKLERLRNELEKDYNAFKKDNKKRYVLWFVIIYSYFNEQLTIILTKYQFNSMQSRCRTTNS